MCCLPPVMMPPPGDDIQRLLFGEVVVAGVPFARQQGHHHLADALDIADPGSVSHLVAPQSKTWVSTSSWPTKRMSPGRRPGSSLSTYVLRSSTPHCTGQRWVDYASWQ